MRSELDDLTEIDLTEPDALQIRVRPNDLIVVTVTDQEGKKRLGRMMLQSKRVTIDAYYPYQLWLSDLGPFLRAEAIKKISIDGDEVLVGDPEETYERLGKILSPKVPFHSHFNEEAKALDITTLPQAAADQSRIDRAELLEEPLEAITAQTQTFRNTLRNVDEAFVRPEVRKRLAQGLSPYTRGLIYHAVLAQLAVIHGRAEVLNALYQLLVEKGLAEPTVDQKAVRAAIERAFASQPALQEALTASEMKRGILDVRDTVPPQEALDALVAKAISDSNFVYVLAVLVHSLEEVKAVDHLRSELRRYARDSYGTFPEKNFQVVALGSEEVEGSELRARAIGRLSEQFFGPKTRQGIVADRTALSHLSIERNRPRLVGEEDPFSQTALIFLLDLVLLRDLPIDFVTEIQNREALDLADRFVELRAELSARRALDMAA